MIKRIYYYFKLKELLKMKGLLPFVKNLLELKPEQESLFIFCMKDYRPIIHWFDYLVQNNTIEKHAKIFASGMNRHEALFVDSLKKRFNQANDIWKKTVKQY